CHHILPRSQGGNDRYANIVLVSEDVHILIHSTDTATINRDTKMLKLDRDNIRKLHTLRKKAGLFTI
ncbi:MAG: HNH endonuclease, partial [Oscillospiraceae bacterium]|nr:HNH endonuclease [Oscillospiraceae bacterium]